MGKRAGIALGLLLGVGLTYELVATGPSNLGVTVSHHRRNAAPSNPLAQSCACQQLASSVVVRGTTWSPDEIGNVNYCSKTGSFAAADAGDFVACGANTPRVQSGAILTENMTVNFLSQGQSFNLWTGVNVNVAVPTVVADLAYAPDGQKSADFVCFPATTAADLSSLHQGVGYGAGIPTCLTDGGYCLQSIYLRGALPDGGECGADPNCYDGGLDVCSYTGTVWHCNNAPFIGNAWVRSSRDGGVSDSVGYWIFGNESLVSGVARPKQCVFAWGAEAQNMADGLSSPIASTGVLTNGQLWTRMADQVENIKGVTRTAWVGDSLSANTVASNSSVPVYPRGPERYAADTSRTVDNWAINGARFESDVGTIKSCQNQWALWAARSSPQRLVFFCGVNDLIGGTANGHTLWTDVQAFIENTVLPALPAGQKVVLVNITPFGTYAGWTAGIETQRGNFNGDMAAYCAGHASTTICIDADAALRDPANHTNLLAANAAPDGLHLSQVGANLLGDTVAAGAP